MRSEWVKRLAGTLGLATMLACVGLHAGAVTPTAPFQRTASEPLSIDALLQLPELQLGTPDPSLKIGSTRAIGIERDGWNYTIHYRRMPDGWRVVGYGLAKVPANGASPTSATWTRDRGGQHASGNLDRVKPSLLPGGGAEPGLPPGPGDVPVPDAPADPTVPVHKSGSSCPMAGFPQYKGDWEWVWVPAHYETNEYGVKVWVPGHYDMIKYNVQYLPQGCT